MAERRVKPFILHRGDEVIGRRNLAGLHETRGHPVEIMTKTFRDSELLRRLEENLKKRGIEYCLIQM